MIISKNIKIQNTIYFLLSFFFVLFIALLSSFNKEVVIDAKISQFIEENVSNPYSFVHTKVTKNTTEELELFNQKSETMQRQLNSDLRTYASYITFQDEATDEFVLNNNIINVSYETKIVYLPYRMDINRTYLESIRLRQFRTDVESRYIAPGYDFSFYISSIMADKIIEESEGMITSYNQILDYETFGIDFSVKINNINWKGHVRNIVYVESSNQYSLDFQKYLNDFIIFYGYKDVVFQGYQHVLNYDFIATNQSIESNLKMLNSFDFGVNNFYNNSNTLNPDLLEIANYMKSNSNILPIQIILYVLMVFDLLALLLMFFSTKQLIFTKLHLIRVMIQLFALFVLHFLIKVLSYFSETSYIYFLFSNYIFGLLSIVMLLFAFAFLFLFYNKIKNYKIKRTLI